MRLPILFLTAILAAGLAHAGTIVLRFEGMTNLTPIGNFYNGGGGGSLGVTFSPNALALCLNTLSEVCSNTSRGGVGDPQSQRGAMYFVDGTETFINYAAGFETGFSFLYTSPFQGARVSVYDGLNGIGNVLATLSLGSTPEGRGGACPGFEASYCPFLPVGVSFSGIARSIGFSEMRNRGVIDDVTFGSSTPGVPEPGTFAAASLGVALLGLARRRRLAAPSPAGS